MLPMVHVLAADAELAYSLALSAVESSILALVVVEAVWMMRELIVEGA